MRNWALFLAFLAFTIHSAQSAQSVRVTEQYSERVVAINDPDLGETFYEVASSNTVTINASLFMPGLPGVVFNDNTPLALTIGNLDFNEVVGNADTVTNNSATFVKRADPDAGTGPVVARMAFTKVGKTLTIAATSSDPEVLVKASERAEDDQTAPGAIAGSLPMSIMVGDQFWEGVVFYKGTKQRKTQQAGGETFTLRSVQLTGALDDIAPTLSVLRPLTNQVVAKALLPVTGKAQDSNGIAQVVVRVNGGVETQALISGTTWTNNVQLTPGTNRIQVFAYDNAGNVISKALTVFLSEPIQLAVDSPGKGQITGLTNGQRLIPGRRYTCTAKPAAGYLFAGWTGSLQSTNPVLAFMMNAGFSLQANFIPHPLLPHRGTYQGLVTDADTYHPTNLAGITFTLNSTGRFTGKLMLAWTNHTISGVFNQMGRAQVNVSRGREPALRLNLQLNIADAGYVSGTLTESGWARSVEAVRSGVLGQASPHRGTYKFLIPGAQNTATAPGGYGFGTLTVASNGAVTIKGKMGDGAPLAVSSVVSQEGYIPVFASMYRLRGVFAGWLQIRTEVEPFQVEGQDLPWIRPPIPPNPERYYLNGFAVLVNLHGERFLAPTPGGNVLPWTSGVMVLSGGNLPRSATNQISINRNRVTVTSGPNTRANIAIYPNGFLGGTFQLPGMPSIAVTGAVLRAEGVAGGMFLGTNQTGAIEFYVPAE